MTPKEEALRIYSSVYNRIEHVISEDLSKNEKEICKGIAIFVVQEIIKETPELVPEETMADDYCTVDWFLNDRYKFWNEVKAEIQKI